MTDQIPETRASKTPQTMKPATAAKKLGVYLPATPPEFQEGSISRAELEELTANPPEWLATLKANGPHPRPVVAAKLGVSIAGLARSGADEPLTTEQIKALLVQPPSWLVEERATQAAVRADKIAIKDRAAEAAKKRR